MSISAENKQKIAGLVKDMLVQHFRDQFVFDPIVVQHEIDHDGDEYLEIYVVFDGDYKKLSSSWRAELDDRVWTESIAMGVPSVPGIAFVEKSEWEEMPVDEYGES